MPVIESSMTDETKGLEVDVAALRKNQDWYEQSSSHFHYGLSRRRGLWAYKIKPFQECGHHPLRLFLLVQLNAKRRINRVETLVSQSHNDGSFGELGVPLFAPDFLTAKSALLAALTDGARDELAGRLTVSAEQPLDLIGLQALIGTDVSSEQTAAIVKRFALPEVGDPLGDGCLYFSDGKPIEIHTTPSGRVKTVIFNPRPFDRVGAADTTGLSRPRVRSALGKRSGGAKDFDRFETVKHATLVAYDEAGNASSVTIMTPEVGT